MYRIFYLTSQFIEVTNKVKIVRSSKHYLEEIFSISDKYLQSLFTKNEYSSFKEKVNYIYKVQENDAIIKNFSKEYVDFIKKKISEEL